LVVRYSLAGFAQLGIVLGNFLSRPGWEPLAKMLSGVDSSVSTSSVVGHLPNMSRVTRTDLQLVFSVCPGVAIKVATARVVARVVPW
jgi:hypothetical protein